MSLDHKTKRKANSIPLGVGKGLLVALLILVLSAALFALLIENEALSMNTGSIWAVVTLAISTLLGCLTSNHCIGRKYAVISAVTAAFYLFVLFALGVLFFDSAFKNVAQNILSILGGGAFACVLSLKSTQKSRKIKRRTR